MKNWMLKEAVKVILDNDNKEEVKEITVNYPLFALAAAQNDLEVFAEIARDIPLEVLFSDGMEEGTEKEGACLGLDPKELDKMSVKDLMAMCDERGIKIPHFGKAKKFYVDKLMAGSGDAGEEDSGEDASEDWEEAAADDYEGKSPRELYDMCKERGLKVETRKTADYYIGVLRKDDESKAKEEDTYDDGWGDDEPAEEEKPAKNTKVTKTGTGKGQKAAKQDKAESKSKTPVNKEDDDWEI